jgi:ABC-type dipeptide/oligopeptide/nickel transport system ATPase component
MGQHDFDFATLFGGPGKHQCRKCRAAVDYPGVCSACGADEERAVYEREIRPARLTVPPDYREGPPVELPEDVRRTIAKGMPKVLALVGDHGTGKSLIAVSILRRLHEQARWAKGQPMPSIRVADRARRSIFIDANELVTEEAERRRGTEAGPLWRAAAAASVLVLDDVRHGKELDAIERLLNLRLNHGLKTIVTTALTADEAKRTRGPAYVSRVYQTAITVSR